MPTELRLFQGPDPTAMRLDEMPDAATAADGLRELGRSSDVLMDDVREGPPREPSPDDNRAEHVVVTMPASASPWAADRAAAKAMEEAAINKEALPSSTVPASRPASSGGAPAAVKPAGVGSDRRAGILIGAVAIAALIFLAVVRPWQGSDPTAGSSGETASMTGAAMTGAAPLWTGTPTALLTSAGVTATTSADTASARVPVPTGTVPAATAGSAASTGVRPAGTASGDPYVDAGPVPKATASVEPTSEPVLTAQPGPSTVPSVTPSATVQNPWDVVYEKRKKESGAP